MVEEKNGSHIVCFQYRKNHIWIHFNNWEYAIPCPGDDATEKINELASDLGRQLEANAELYDTALDFGFADKIKLGMGEPTIFAFLVTGPEDLSDIIETSIDDILI